MRINLAAASTYSTTFILDTVLAFLIPFVTYNAECHIFKAGNIPATSRLNGLHIVQGATAACVFVCSVLRHVLLILALSGANQ